MGGKRSTVSPWLLAGALAGGVILHGRKARAESDSTPPGISITNPVDTNIQTNTYPYTLAVSGTAVDNVSLSSITVALYNFDNGSLIIPLTAATGLSNWSINIQIPGPGAYLIKAQAKDGAGNASSATLEVSLERPPAPVQPPTLAFMHGLNKLSFALSAITTQPKLLKFIADNGFGLIRVRLYWEKYLQDPVTWQARLQATADAADANGLKIIYDFHQFGQSSYFNSSYIGWPPSMVSAAIGPLSGYATIDAAQKAWMRKWWDNAGTFNNKTYWDAQVDFMLQAFGIFKDRASTRGYEILNEPDLYEITDLANYKLYLEYIGSKLIDNDNDAWIVADHRFNKYGTGADFYNIDQIKATIPTISNGRVVYSPHTYFKGNENLDAPTGIWVVERIAQIQAAIGNIPVFIGEWNDVGHDPVRMQKIVNAFKAKNFSHALYVFEHAVDTANACFNSNYDKIGNCWDSLLFAMGRTQIGSPK